MNKLIIVYGLIAGLVVISINTISFELGYGYVWLGFLVMFIAFSTIFVAVKQYRDQTLGGVIRFGQALMLGLGVTLVASVVYVAVWELYQYLTGYGFIETYTASLIEEKQVAGVAGAELETFIAEMEAFKLQYENPLFRLPTTMLEIFPIGLLVSLVAAAVLKNSKTLPAV